MALEKTADRPVIAVLGQPQQFLGLTTVEFHHFKPLSEATSKADKPNRSRNTTGGRDIGNKIRNLSDHFTGFAKEAVWMISTRRANPERAGGRPSPITDA
jgi:hypothetical protein